MYFAVYNDYASMGHTLDDAFNNLIETIGDIIGINQAIFYEAEEIKVQIERKPSIKKSTKE